jgi:transposase InsO family protein
MPPPKAKASPNRCARTSTGTLTVSYRNLAGTFHYLCSILDGYSRAIVHWEARETMKETDVAIIFPRAIEKLPGVHPRIISDTDSQSNGKLERIGKWMEHYNTVAPAQRDWLHCPGGQT